MSTILSTDRQPTKDEQYGIDWWNSLHESERAERLLAIGPSATVAEAWEEYKRQTKKTAYTVELTDDEAWDFAQYLKRAGHSDYRVNAQNDEEAYRMLLVGEKVRAALAAHGIAPR